ncbi:MAG: CotH kinase family protein [Verrucomicrobia bacterium]|nr:CotH kinase family protein [Verrucomicrobiota bacterium]
MRRFEQAVNGPDFRSRVGYAAFLDTPEAFIDQLWLIGMSKNIDDIRYSAYVHKERGGKLRMGPAWDWNLAFGNMDTATDSDPTG